MNDSEIKQLEKNKISSMICVIKIVPTAFKHQQLRFYQYIQKEYEVKDDSRKIYSEQNRWNQKGLAGMCEIFNSQQHIPLTTTAFRNIHMQNYRRIYGQPGNRFYMPTA
jgi:hypothetical protein